MNEEEKWMWKTFQFLYNNVINSKLKNLLLLNSSLFIFIFWLTMWAVEVCSYCSTSKTCPVRNKGPKNTSSTICIRISFKSCNSTEISTWYKISLHEAALFMIKVVIELFNVFFSKRTLKTKSTRTNKCLHTFFKYSCGLHVYASSDEFSLTLPQ